MVNIHRRDTLDFLYVCIMNVRIEFPHKGNVKEINSILQFIITWILRQNRTRISHITN